MKFENVLVCIMYTFALFTVVNADCIPPQVPCAHDSGCCDCMPNSIYNAEQYCECEAGYFMQNFTGCANVHCNNGLATFYECVACAENTFKPLLGNLTECENCPAQDYTESVGSTSCIHDPICPQNQYSLDGDCTACPEHSVSQRAQVKCYNEGIDDCVCGDIFIANTLDEATNMHNPVIYYPVSCHKLA